MNLGKKQSQPVDLSSTLRDADSWSPRSIRRLGLNGDVTALAVEPLSGLLVLGTNRGSLHFYGSPAASLELAVPGAPYRKIRFITFAQSFKKVVVVGMHE
jgi:syntaxin-binding protein 5